MIENAIFQVINKRPFEVGSISETNTEKINMQILNIRASEIYSPCQQMFFLDGMKLVWGFQPFISFPQSHVDSQQFVPVEIISICTRGDQPLQIFCLPTASPLNKNILTEGPFLSFLCQMLLNRPDPLHFIAVLIYLTLPLHQLML